MTAPDTRLIVNTSPLIHLAEADLMDLLRDAGSSVWVPEPVAREIRTYGDDDPTAQALVKRSWLEVRHSAAPPSAIQAWDLGAGESSVLALALGSPGSTVIIDDLAGRRCAEALGLPLRGTVGLVLAAKQAGRIRAARPVLEQLRDGGMYLSEAVLSRALQWVAE